MVKKLENKTSESLLFLLLLTLTQLLLFRKGGKSNTTSSTREVATEGNGVANASAFKVFIIQKLFGRLQAGNISNSLLSNQKVCVQKTSLCLLIRRGEICDFLLLTLSHWTSKMVINKKTTRDHRSCVIHRSVIVALLWDMSCELSAEDNTLTKKKKKKQKLEKIWWMIVGQFEERKNHEEGNALGTLSSYQMNRSQIRTIFGLFPLAFCQKSGSRINVAVTWNQEILDYQIQVLVNLEVFWPENFQKEEKFVRFFRGFQFRKFEFPSSSEFENWQVSVFGTVSWNRDSHGLDAEDSDSVIQAIIASDSGFSDISELEAFWA